MAKPEHLLVRFIETGSVPDGSGKYSKGSALFSYDEHITVPTHKEILPGIYERVKGGVIVIPSFSFALQAKGEDLVVYSFDGRCGWHEVLIDKKMAVDGMLRTGKLSLSVENFPASERSGRSLEMSVDIGMRCILNPFVNLWCIDFPMDTSTVEYVQIGSSLVAGIDADRYLWRLFITNIRMID